MNWQDKGYLLSLNKYNENSSIAEFFTKDHGKITGTIFGSSSKKIKNYLLIGNKFHINFVSKDESKIGYFKLEIDQIFTPIYFDNKKKLYCIIYAMNLLKILNVDNQENINIYNLITEFFKILIDDNWLFQVILWELKFFKIIGYDIDFRKYVINDIVDGDQKYFVDKNKKEIPNFLINKNTNPKDNNELLSGFKIVGNFLDKTIIKPNNLNYPISRTEFINLIK